MIDKIGRCYQSSDIPFRLWCFSRPYSSRPNGRAIGMVVGVCPSVCHRCIVAKRCEIRPRLLL